MKTDRDRARAKAMFAQMTPKEKRVHILRYYWIHMVAGLFALVVASTLAVTLYNNAKTRNCVYVGIQQEYYAQLQPRVEQIAAQAEWPEGLNYMTYPSTSSPDGMGSMQMMMYLAADQLDSAVCDERTTTLLQQDETMRCRVWPLEETALGQGHTTEEPMFLVIFADTARGEKAERFQRLLTGAAALQSN